MLVRIGSVPERRKADRRVRRVRGLRSGVLHRRDLQLQPMFEAARLATRDVRHRKPGEAIVELCAAAEAHHRFGAGYPRAVRGLSAERHRTTWPLWRRLAAPLPQLNAHLVSDAPENRQDLS